MTKQRNVAYIDGQNLHMGTHSDGWSIDYTKFRTYLRDKYNIIDAYYFLGFVSESEQELYNSLQKAGFIVVFREHSSTLKGKKKGNVDVDMVFEMMKNIVEDEDYDKIVLVSGDGDYFKVVRYLIKKGLLEKVLFPNKNHSSLYKKITNQYYHCLADAKQKIEYKKRGS